MDVRELIKSVAQKCHKEDHVPAIIKTIVEDNWLDSLSALQALTPEEWTQLQLPLKFVNLLRAEIDSLTKPVEKVNVTETSELAPPSVARTPPSANTLPVANTPSATASSQLEESSKPVCKSSRTFETITYGPPPKTHHWAELDLKLTLDVLLSAGASERKTLTMLQKITGNCVKDPANEKFRKIRKNNAAIATEILDVTGGYEFLQGLGFEDEGEWLILYDLYLERIEYAHSIISAEVVKADRLMTPQEAVAAGKLKFDPFKSYQISKTGNKLSDKNIDHAEYTPANIKQLIETELRLRECGGLSPEEKIPLDPVYKPPEAMGPTIVRLPPDGSVPLEDDDTEGPSFTSDDLRRLKDVLTGNLKFRSKMVQQLASVRKIPVYSKCRLVLIAPNQASVSISVRPDMTMAMLHRLIWDSLITENMRIIMGDPSKFWLSDPPLRPRLPAEDTVFHLGLVPAGRLRIMSSIDKSRELQWLRAVF